VRASCFARTLIAMHSRRAPLLVPALLIARAAFAQCPDGTPPPCRSVSASRAAPLPGSIAVLPFTNRSPDSADAYLADALPERIVGRLARVNNLHVKSATAVSAQWRRTPDPMAAARELRVEWFVTGSIRRAGRQLAVSAELVRASTGDGAWGAPFRRRDADLGAVEEGIAESVAVAIVGRLAPAQASALRRDASRNPEAYRLYLYGRARAVHRTNDDIQAAVEAFARAIRLDPGFAAAWAQLGYMRALQFQYGNREGLAADSVIALARAAAERALALDSLLAEGWQAQGTIAAVTFNIGESHARLTRAIQLDSLNFDTYHSMGYLYGADLLDLANEAVPLLRRAIELNPDSRNSWRHVALARRDQGRLAEAEALLDTALSLGTWSLGSSERAFVRFARGNGAGALADLQNVDSVGAFAGLIPRVLRDLARARAVYRMRTSDSATTRPAVEQFGSWPGAEADESIALLRLLLGSRDGALDALERLRATPDSLEAPCGPAPCSASLRTWRALHDPILAPLQGEPRFQRLLAETRPRVPWLERP
jgi:TolB-like protein